MTTLPVCTPGFLTLMLQSLWRRIPRTWWSWFYGLHWNQGVVLLVMSFLLLSLILTWGIVIQLFNCGFPKIQEGSDQKHKARIDPVTKTIMGETEKRLVSACSTHSTLLYVFNYVIVPSWSSYILVLEFRKKSSSSETHRRPHFIADPTCRFIGDPKILIGDPYILIKDPTIFISDTDANKGVSNENIGVSNANIGVSDENIGVSGKNIGAHA